MPKNIVVFSDGTGQEGGTGNNTNVYKLFNMIVDRSPEQIAFYDRGLGTGRNPLTGKGAGMGISRNIKECYRFIFDHYEAGDKIYLFGFSRGAATVRSLSGFIHLFGILPKSRPELIGQAYKIYRKKNPDVRMALAAAFVARNHTMWTDIQFLGVWDTVAALGVPFKWLDSIIDRIPRYRHKFHDFRLSKSVLNAYHALAVDDERRTFRPVLWDPKTIKGQVMRQVWFCGMHTDVGGGYAEQDLSDIALDWMKRMAKKQGLRIYPKNKVNIHGDADGKMHNSRDGFFWKISPVTPREWPKGHGRPVVHESVTRRRRDRNNGKGPYSPWILRKFKNPEIEP